MKIVIESKEDIESNLSDIKKIFRFMKNPFKFNETNRKSCFEVGIVNSKIQIIFSDYGHVLGMTANDDSENEEDKFYITYEIYLNYKDYAKFN